MKKILFIATVLMLWIITAITTTTQAMASIVPITSTTGSVDNVIRQINKPVKYKWYKLLTKKERAKLDAMCNKVGSWSYYFQQSSSSWSGEVRYTTINSYWCRCARDRPWNQNTKQCDIPNPKNNPYFIWTWLATWHINSTVTSWSILLTWSTNPQKDTGYALCIDKCVSWWSIDFINTKAARTFDEVGKYQYFWKYAKSAVNIQCVAQCKIDNPNY